MEDKDYIEDLSKKLTSLLEEEKTEAVFSLEELQHVVLDANYLKDKLSRSVTTEYHDNIVADAMVLVVKWKTLAMELAKTGQAKPGLESSWDKAIDKV